MHRKMDILIFGLIEYKNEIFYDMLESSGKYLREVMKLEIGCKNTDYLSRKNKLQIFWSTRNYTRMKLRIEQDYLVELRTSRKEVTSW
jgi:hypothetical protein